MKLLPLVCLCLLTWSGGTFGDQHGVITVEEGSDVILPCSLSTSENIESKLFDWKKDGQKKVFLYNSGIHSINSPSGQDVQFTGRVSHFPDELKHGNASIIIRNTKVADSGNYTCGFPLLQPERKVHIQLVVGGILKDRSKENIPEVKVEEGSDVILPCSLSTSENIELELFDWKKDGQKRVFLYNSGIHSINSPSGQDVQFRGRVSHFKDELKHGNASIIIINTKVADSGDYTCGFPLLPTERKVHIQLVVGGILKDRSEENPGAAPKPYVTILDQTKDWSLLQCFVRGASPKPQLQWQDSVGNILPAKEPQVSERGGVILQTNVTKTDNYRCVATQEEINHHTDAEIYVLINESSTDFPTGWVVAAVFITLFVAVVVVLLIVLYAKGVIPLNCKKDIQHPVGVYTHDSSRDKSDQTAGQELNSQVNQPLNETA